MNFYKILGISRCATSAEVRSAYISLVKKWHPDKNPGSHEAATKQLQAVNNAYTTLSNEKLRTEYDNQIVRTRIDSVYRARRPKPQPNNLSKWDCNYSRKPSKPTQPSLLESIFGAIFNTDYSEQISVERTCISGAGMTTFTTKTKYANGKTWVVNFRIESSGKVEIERILDGKVNSKNVIFPAYRF